MSNMMKPVAVLTLICVVASALLALTDGATRSTIAQVQKAASDQAMMDVLPGATAFTNLDGSGLDTSKILLAAKENGGAGYAFKVQDKGFGGAYVVMVGVDNDGKVTGAKLLDNSETPGLGSKTGEKVFTDRFTGKSNAQVNEVETIVGVTISSNAFKRGVASALEAYEMVKGAA